MSHGSIKTRMPVSAVSVIACFIPVHGYRFFHLLASGDALLLVYQNDAAWEIALGRFMQPFALLFRGALTTPFLINVLMTVWLVLAVFFTSLYLELQSVLSIALVSAFFVINRTVVMLNGSYLPWADSYMFSLLLAVTGIYLAGGTLYQHHSVPEVTGGKNQGTASGGIFRKDSFRIVCGGVLMAMSLGFYQAYICVALGLCAIRLMLDLARGTDKTEMIKRLLREAIAFVIAAVLYVICWKGAQRVFHIWNSDSYNGLSDVSSLAGGIADGSLLGTVYGNVWRFFANPVTVQVMPFRGMDLGDVWVFLSRAAHVVLFALALYHLVRVNRLNKTETWRRVLQAVLFLLLPLCVNLVCLLSGGMQHVLMMYAFLLYYVLAIALAEYDGPAGIASDAPGGVPEKTIAGGKSAGASGDARRVPLTAVLLLTAILILWPQVISTNQTYLKKSLQEEAAQSLMVRVLQTVEQTEGYEPGVTQVFFAGALEQNPYIESKDLLEDELPWGTMKTTFTYGGIEQKWLSFFEHMTVNLYEEETAETGMLPGEQDAVKDMPCFPVQGSVTYVGDVLVVKLSD